METCFILVMAGAVLGGICYAYGHIRDLEAALAKRCDAARKLQALRIQRELDQEQITRYEIEIQSLKARLQ